MSGAFCLTAFLTRGCTPCANALKAKRHDHESHAFCLFYCLANTTLKRVFFIDRGFPLCYSTVTLFARFQGLSTSQPRITDAVETGDDTFIEELNTAIDKYIN